MIFEWKKRGLIFDPSKRFEWMHAYSQVPTILDKGQFFRIYFTTRPVADDAGKFISHISYIDVDKVNPHQVLHVHPQPILQLGKPGTFDEFGIHPTAIINNHDSTHLYYTGWTRGTTVPYETFIGLATSSNMGDTFERYSEGAIIGKDYNNPYLANGAFVFRYKDSFAMLYASAKKWAVADNKYEPVYNLKIAFSANGVDWNTDVKTTFPAEEDECISRPAVIEIEGIYHAWYGYRKIGQFRNGGMNGYRIGYARSNNLLEWERRDTEAGINLSDNGWDSEMMSYPYIVKTEGKFLMFYNGNDFGKNGFGYAELTLI